MLREIGMFFADLPWSDFFSVLLVLLMCAVLVAFLAAAFYTAWEVAYLDPARKNKKAVKVGFGGFMLRIWIGFILILAMCALVKYLGSRPQGPVMKIENSIITGRPDNIEYSYYSKEFDSDK